MEILIKIKFVPLILGLVTLITGMCLKYLLQIYVENTIIKFGTFLTIAGFIFIQAMREYAKEKLKKEQNQKPKKNIQEIKMEKIRNEIYKIKNRGIPASFIRHFFSTFTALGGIIIIVVNKEYIFGSILFVITTLLNIISLRWTIKYFKRLGELKNMLRNDEIFIEETKSETKKIVIIMLMLIILAIIGIIGIKIMKNILEKTL
jgi:hypothetical protein